MMRDHTINDELASGPVDRDVGRELRALIDTAGNYGAWNGRDVLSKALMELDRLRTLARLVMRLTGEDANGEMPHEPRAALLILRRAAEAVLTPNAEVTGRGPKETR